MQQKLFFEGTKIVIASSQAKVFLTYNSCKKITNVNFFNLYIKINSKLFMKKLFVIFLIVSVFKAIIIKI